MKTGPTVLIIFHERDRQAKPARLLDLLLPSWRDKGIRIETAFGIRKKIPADLALLHVDLSVVPPCYLDFVSHYPWTINSRVSDIRKTTFSLNRVKSAESYPGPVLVKTALNYAGVPERRRHPLYPWNEKISKRLSRVLKPWKKKKTSAIRTKSDYRIYLSSAEVPPECFSDPRLIVEKFLPEKHGDFYCLREWYFFGKHERCRAELSKDPIFTSGEVSPELVSKPPLEVRKIRETLGLDYGKIDYVLHEGKAVVFDINKTPGVTHPIKNCARQIGLDLADGVDDFLPPSWSNSRSFYG